MGLCNPPYIFPVKQIWNGKSGDTKYTTLENMERALYNKPKIIMKSK